MASITANSRASLLDLSDKNFWYMGNLARSAVGPTYLTGDTSTNQRLGGERLLFEGDFNAWTWHSPEDAALRDPVYSVSILDFSDNRAVTLTFAPGTIEEDLRFLEGKSDLEAFEAILRFDDTITLSDYSDSASGYRGHDLIEGRGGNDTLLGGDGGDTIFGGDGADSLNGEGGHDKLQGGTGSDRLEGENGRDTMLGGQGDDTLSGGGAGDRLVGGAGKDVLLGGDYDDVLSGGKGRDQIYGGTGSDTLKGGAHGDRLFGGADDDTLDGGAGNDLLTGNRGNDVFVFADGGGADRIQDFAAKNDAEKIDLTGVSGLVSFADDLQGLMQQQGDDVLIDFSQGDSLLLLGVSLTDLDAMDFLL